jgi:hypothetical protein
MDVAQLIRAAPLRPLAEEGALAHCIEAASDCAEAASFCADSCLGDGNVAKLRLCIRLSLDAADLCHVLVRILARQLDPDLAVLTALLEACAVALGSCADECERHAHHDHCRLAMEASRRAEEACRDLLAALPPVPEEPPGPDGAPGDGAH